MSTKPELSSESLDWLIRSICHADGVCEPPTVNAEVAPAEVLAEFTRSQPVLQAFEQFCEQIKTSWQAFNQGAQFADPAFPAGEAQTDPDVPTMPTLPLDIPSLTKDFPMPFTRPGHPVIPSFSHPAKPFPSNRPSFFIGKNAKVGEPFDAMLEMSGVEDLKIINMEIPPELGLVFDPESRRLQGIPAVAGEYPLKFSYRLTAVMEGECRLVVNPDPRSLWKDLPSDPRDKDWKPDAATAFIPGKDGCKMVAASQRGRSHAHVGSFRDDDFLLDAETDWNILAVADGAGSAPQSRKGSQIAVQRAVEKMKQCLEGGEVSGKLRELAARPEWALNLCEDLKKELYPVLGGAAFAAHKAIEDEAVANGSPVKDYATTLILGLHRKLQAGHLFATFWVGDGAVAVYRRGVGVELLGEVDSGEYAGQTRFLDQTVLSSYDEIMKRLNVSIAPDFTVFALMSDGISDPKFETDGNLVKPVLWDALWDELSPLLDAEKPDERLLEWMSFWSPGNHDDRTLALLAPGP